MMSAEISAEMRISRAVKKESSLQEMLDVANLSLSGQLPKVDQRQLLWIHIFRGRLNFRLRLNPQLARSWSNFQVTPLHR
jgi:hypothetical protein